MAPAARILILLCFFSITSELSCRAFVLPDAPEFREINDVSIVSSFVPVGQAAPTECKEQARIFVQLLASLPRPRSWHWVLICDGAGWRKFLELSGRAETENIIASTDLLGRTTYIEGAKLLTNRSLNPEPKKVVAHELAHIWLGINDEADAKKLTEFLVRGFPENAFVLEAGR